MSYANGGIFEDSGDVYMGGFSRTGFPYGIKDANIYMAVAGILILFSAIVVMFQSWGYKISADNNRRMTWVSSVATMIGLVAVGISVFLAKSNKQDLKLAGITITL